MRIEDNLADIIRSGEPRINYSAIKAREIYSFDDGFKIGGCEGTLEVYYDLDEGEDGEPTIGSIYKVDVFCVDEKGDKVDIDMDYLLSAI